MRDDEPKRPMGNQPMPYNPDHAEFICEILATSPHGLAWIVNKGKGEFGKDTFPGVTTIFKWLDCTPEFAKLYARAKESQGHFVADETLEIADETKEDYVKRLNFDGPLEGWEVNGEAIARSRLRIETRKWHAAHLAPKRWGEKLEVDQKISADDPLLSLLGRIADNGRRLVPQDDEDKAE